jgi:hypothetical protein
MLLPLPKATMQSAQRRQTVSGPALTGYLPVHT